MFAPRYSEKELKLIEHYGFSDIAAHVSTTALYKLMVEKAFIADERTLWDEVLRRCMKAFEAGEPYRCTPEWDALLDLEACSVPKCENCQGSGKVYDGWEDMTDCPECGNKQ